jgi:hypothetical protein
MSAPRPLEADYLSEADSLLAQKNKGRDRGQDFELRLQLLEAASSLFGGFSLEAYQHAFGIHGKRPPTELLELASPVVAAIERSAIHPAMALSALAREALHEHDRKSTGAYHTDFRLAERLAQVAAPKLSHKSKVIDPACGAGILLAALTHAVCGRDRAKVSQWLANGVCAADLSANSLRAALLSLASFTEDLKALKTMRSRWYCGDSLLAPKQVWTKLAPNGFDAVVGNPPWEKVKLSRHEYLRSAGAERHYGARIEGLDESHFQTQRNEVAAYAKKLAERYPELRRGEPDLYIAFADLFFELCKGHGIVAALIPGGFIRSQGTEAIRRKIFQDSHSVALSVVDNRARFFSIDSRFKFLVVGLVKASSAGGKRDPVRLFHETGTATGLKTTGAAILGRSALEAARADLSVPEVRSPAEWRLFTKISRAGASWADARYGWRPKFCREVDMTKERPRFLRRPAPGALPVVEGRMVHAHRFGVKGHLSGTGRSSLWEPYALGASQLRPQFWIRLEDVPKVSRHRTGQVRAGFCDIAGQTNERSLMAALIPPGVASGNKVPTILFPDDPSEERLLVWVCIANSFAFDWMLRRVLTTTVNYFLLESVPLPRVARDGLPWKKLVVAGKELRSLDSAGASRKNVDRMAQLRAEVDAEVAVAYGLNTSEMELVLSDFPILDRGQPALRSETRSTITRDMVLAAVAQRTSNDSKVWLRRAADAAALGASAFVPSELALGRDESEQEGAWSNG